MTDKQIIENAGGTSAFAKLLGVTEQRVSNWKRRGIPAKIKWENQEIIHKFQPPKNKTP